MALREWHFSIHDQATGQHLRGTTATGWVYVCTAGSVTPPTIYCDPRGTSSLSATANGTGVLANTLAVVYLADGYCRFWTETSVTSLDISWVTATGETGMARGISSSRQMLPVNTNGGQPYVLAVPFAFIASSAVQDTQIDLPADLCIFDANVDVVTTDASATVDVGFLNSGESGDEDGLLDGMLTTSAGLGTPAGIITNGSNIDYVDDASGKYGALLVTWIDGADAVTTVGGMTRKMYRTDGTIKSLTYTPSNSDTMYGFIYLWYTKLMG